MTKAANTREARKLLEGWGYEPSNGAIKEVAQALADARAETREADAVIAETHSAADCDGPDCGVVIAAAIRAKTKDGGK